ncbi:MAG: hypothetical protein NC253_12375 [Ruminococcus sp.]|nr:hypothetical protein [Ruminococcus sp.]MCM1382393.1 hypothetical protein [Muribaculaceae bacterium]MCM1479321.1 hypothetical protein [Muribaculaceae bacterium]
MKNYKFSFDVWGLAVFLLIMLPNFIWFAVPAPNDILRGETKTAVIDGIGSVCQALFAAAICFIKNKKCEKIRVTPKIIAAALCVLIYFAGWGFYYSGITAPAVIICLTLPPCLAFLFFALDRKNYIAVIFIAAFTVCHFIYGAVNFIL